MFPPPTGRPLQKTHRHRDGPGLMRVLCAFSERIYANAYILLWQHPVGWPWRGWTGFFGGGGVSELLRSHAQTVISPSPTRHTQCAPRKTRALTRTQKRAVRIHTNKQTTRARHIFQCSIVCARMCRASPVRAYCGQRSVPGFGVTNCVRGAKRAFFELSSKVWIISLVACCEKYKYGFCCLEIAEIHVKSRFRLVCCCTLTTTTQTNRHRIVIVWFSGDNNIVPCHCDDIVSNALPIITKL